MSNRIVQGVMHIFALLKPQRVHPVAMGDVKIKHAKESEQKKTTSRPLSSLSSSAPWSQAKRHSNLQMLVLG
eukprot:3060100-Amphidinium_carterae.1